MSANGVHGVYRTWKVGFVNIQTGKYLTCEKFGEINVTGNSLKKQQVFTLEQDTTAKGFRVYIRSYLGRYIVANRHGNATLKGEEERPDEDGFDVEYSPDGKWSFKHGVHNNYLGVKGDNKTLQCYNKDSPKEGDWWAIQLYMHPQVHLYNCGRKAYANVIKDDDGFLACKDKMPWGADSLITLVFSDGKYSFKTCNNRYLSNNGELVEERNASTGFAMEIQSGSLAFKDVEGRYLVGIGNKGMLKTKGKSGGGNVPDELFHIYDSCPQVQIISQSGEGKLVSVKQGLDVSANQSQETNEAGDTEIFQMEHDQASGTWAFATHTNKYWTLKGDQPPSIQIASEKSTKSMFTVKWQDDGSVAFIGSDGNYIANKPTGVMFSNNKDDVNKFVINIVNRPLLVLKGEHGFVGLNKNQCVCNTPTYDTFALSCKGNGVYNLKTPNGQFLSLDDSKTLVLDDNSGADFQFQFCGGSQLAIKEKGGNFLRGDQNGIIKANATELDSSSKWEF